MAKKNNLYVNLNFEDIKNQLNDTLTELNKVDINNLEDEIEFRSGMNGVRIPYIISSIEDKLKTMVTIISDSIEQLKVINSEEDGSPFVLEKVVILKSKVEAILFYFKQRPSSTLRHRFKDKEVEVCNSRGCRNVTYHLEAASKEDQEKTKSLIQKSMLKIIPSLSQLETNTKESIVRGGGDIPIRMKLSKKFKPKNRDV